MRSLKLFWVLLFTIFGLSCFGQESLNGGFSSPDYEKASTNESNYLKFVVESTKVGLFSSRHSVQFDRTNMILRDMTITFKVEDMDTDHESRDEKLHTKCMGMSKYPKLTVTIKGPAFLKDKRERDYPAIVNIRGKDHEVMVKMKVEVNEKDIIVSGSSVWSLKALEIPDPSIAVAKLSDDIRIFFKHTIAYEMDSTESKGE